MANSTDTASDAKTELIPPVNVATDQTVSERIVAKVTSGRLACLILMTVTLCGLAIKDPAAWKDPFLMILAGFAGSYATKGTGGAR